MRKACAQAHLTQWHPGAPQLGQGAGLALRMFAHLFERIAEEEASEEVCHLHSKLLFPTAAEAKGQRSAMLQT
jgi:hypothetical protein